MRALTWNALIKTKIEPGKSLAIVADPAVYVRGQYQLRYRVRPSGAITAQLQFKRDGKWATATVGDVPRTAEEVEIATKARLQAWRESGSRIGINLGELEPIREQARAMLPGLLSGPDPRGKDTLRSLIDLYIKHRVAGLRPRTRLESQRHLLKHWAPFHDRPATSLTKGEIAAHLFRLKEESGGVAALRSRATLRAMYAWAFDADRIEAMPPFPSKRALGVKEQARDRVLSLEELRSIWAATEEPGDYNTCLRLLALTGQRLSEVGSMRWSEVNLERALWSMPGSRTKNGQPHEVALSAQAVAILAALPRREGRDLIFGIRKGGFSGWPRCKRLLDARCGVADWTHHTLRHSFITHCCGELDIAPHVVEEIVNHVSGHKAGIAGIYNHSKYRAQKVRAMQAFADWLLDAEPAQVIQLRG